MDLLTNLFSKRPKAKREKSRNPQAPTKRAVLAANPNAANVPNKGPTTAMRQDVQTATKISHQSTLSTASNAPASSAKSADSPAVKADSLFSTVAKKPTTLAFQSLILSSDKDSNPTEESRRISQMRQPAIETPKNSFFTYHMAFAIVMIVAILIGTVLLRTHEDIFTGEIFIDKSGRKNKVTGPFRSSTLEMLSSGELRLYKNGNLMWSQISSFTNDTSVGIFMNNATKKKSLRFMKSGDLMVFHEKNAILKDQWPFSDYRVVVSPSFIAS